MLSFCTAEFTIQSDFYIVMFFHKLMIDDKLFCFNNSSV